MESRDLISVETRLETDFCESRSRRFQVSSRSRRLQVSRLRILQKMVLHNFYNSTIFCLLHLQERTNQNWSEKCQKFEKNSTQKLSRHKIFRQIAQILKSRVSGFFMKSRSRSFNQVSDSVSKVTISVTWLGFSRAIHIQFTIISLVLFWVLASGSSTVANGPVSAKFPTWIKPLVMPLFILWILSNAAAHSGPLRQRAFGALPNFFRTNSLARFYTQHDHNHCIIQFYTSISSF